MTFPNDEYRTQSICDAQVTRLHPPGYRLSTVSASEHPQTVGGKVVDRGKVIHASTFFAVQSAPTFG